MGKIFLKSICNFTKQLLRKTFSVFFFESLRNWLLNKKGLSLSIRRPKSAVRIITGHISIEGRAVNLKHNTTAPVRVIIKHAFFFWKKKQILTIALTPNPEPTNLPEISGTAENNTGFSEKISMRAGVWTLLIQAKASNGQWITGKRFLLFDYPTLKKKLWRPYWYRNYKVWTKIEKRGLTRDIKDEINRHITSMPRKPTFSVILDLSRSNHNIHATFQSLRNQIYPHFEICILGYSKTHNTISAFDANNIHYLENDKVLDVHGDYCIFIDAGDCLHPYALYEFASALNCKPELDILYGDEDTIDRHGNHDAPFFKPDWSPDYLEVLNYIEFPSCYKSQLAIAGYSNRCLYDLALCSTEVTQNIFHIPKVLGHRDKANVINGEYQRRNKSYCKSLQSRLKRTGRIGQVSEHPKYAGAFTYTSCLKTSPLISIIVPTNGSILEINERKIDLLANLITQIHERSSYQNIDVVVVENGNLSASQENVLKKFGCRTTRFLEAQPNIARKINQGVRHSSGDYLLILNDDIEILTDDWLERMVRHFEKPGIGIVGCRLLYPEGSIQHAGVVYVNGHPQHVSRNRKGDESGYFFSTALVRNYVAVTGACMMTPRDVFLKTGGYNERFPINYNDIEYCLKVRQSGDRIVYDGTCVLTHLESASRTSGIKPFEKELYERDVSRLLSSDPYYNHEVFNTENPSFKFCINRKSP